jgi:DNA-binding winged helix-turn-helix (wHTH) protein
VRFGPFTVDTETRQLIRENADLHLSTKAFDLLCGLLEHRPKVLDKAALHARLWPDTFVVDGNLNVLVAEIRRVLDDDARDPRFIRTVHGVGYAFCGAVRRDRTPGRRRARCRAGWRRAARPTGWPRATRWSGAIPTATCGSTRRASRVGTRGSRSTPPPGACGWRT